MYTKNQKRNEFLPLRLRVKMNKKDIKDKIKNGIMYSVFGIASLNPQFSNASENQNRDDTQNRIEQIKASAQNKQEANTAEFNQNLRNITYYDSKYIDEYGTQGAAFSSLYNNIYNTRETDETVLELTLQILHEAHHKDDYLQKIMSHDMSPQEYFILNSHLEISANITSCLAIRDGFKKAKDKKAFLDNLEQQSPTARNFKFYIDKLRDQTITPDKTISKQEFDAEMTFIINGTRDMWLNKFMKDYDSKFIQNGHYRKRVKGTNGQSNPDSFNRGLNITYTMGGINLSKYLFTPEIEISPKQQELLSLIKYDKASQNLTFEDIYGTGKNRAQTDRAYETTPKTISVLDLSPASRLLSAEYERLSDEPIKTQQLDNLTQLNNSLKQKIGDEKLKYDYTLGTIDKVAENLEKRGFFHNYEDMAHNLCNKYGDKAPELVNLVSEFPNLMLNNNETRFIRDRKTLNANEAIQVLAAAKPFSKQETDILLGDFKNIYLTLGKSLSVLDNNGQYKEDGNNPFASHYQLRNLTQKVFTSAQYLKTDKDLEYFQSILKSPDLHPEIWPNTGGANVKHTHKILFESQMTKAQFEELKTKHVEINEIGNILGARANSENQEISKNEDKITPKDISALSKHLIDEFGQDNAKKIAQAIVDTPKKFGAKSLAKLIHTRPAASNNFMAQREYGEKKSKQTQELREQIKKFAKANNLGKDNTKTINLVNNINTR